MLNLSALILVEIKEIVQLIGSLLIVIVPAKDLVGPLSYHHRLAG